MTSNKEAAHGAANTTDGNSTIEGTKEHPQHTAERAQPSSLYDCDEFERKIITTLRTWSPEGQRLMYEYTTKAVAAEKAGKGFGSVPWEPYQERILEANRAYKLTAIHRSAETELVGDILPLRDQ